MCIRDRIDDPDGTGRERFAAQPVAGPDGHVHAVLIALRDEAAPPFGRADLDKLEALAAAWAPYLLQMSMRVERGQVLARLHDAEQVGQLNTLETEFESKLVAYLQSPADPAVKQALGQIRSQRDGARLSVESRAIRAPHAGVVKEVLVRNGQRVE